MSKSWITGRLGWMPDDVGDIDWGDAPEPTKAEKTARAAPHGNTYGRERPDRRRAQEAQTRRQTRYQLTISKSKSSTSKTTAHFGGTQIGASSPQ